MVLLPALAPAGWPRRVLAAALVALPLLVGWSRVRLGAHWPSDVLGGWLWGAAVALLMLELIRWVGPAWAVQFRLTRRG